MYLASSIWLLSACISAVTLLQPSPIAERSLVHLRSRSPRSPSNTTLTLPTIISSNETNLAYDANFQYGLPATTSAAVQCDGSLYGVFLNRGSCDEAVGKIGLSTSDIRVGQRGLRSRFQVYFPRRYSSCKRYQAFLGFTVAHIQRSPQLHVLTKAYCDCCSGWDLRY